MWHWGSRFIWFFLVIHILLPSKRAIQKEETVIEHLYDIPQFIETALFSLKRVFSERTLVSKIQKMNFWSFKKRQMFASYQRSLRFHKAGYWSFLFIPQTTVDKISCLSTIIHWHTKTNKMIAIIRRMSFAAQKSGNECILMLLIFGAVWTEVSPQRRRLLVRAISFMHGQVWFSHGNVIKKVR